MKAYVVLAVVVAIVAVSAKPKSSRNLFTKLHCLIVDYIQHSFFQEPCLNSG